MAAEIVLSDDKKFVQAIYAKAEALYNTCQFEHALVYFVRGQVRNSDGKPRPGFDFKKPGYQGRVSGFQKCTKLAIFG